MPTEELTGMERRAEPRQPAQGVVLLRLTNGASVSLDGQLLDIAPSGFRASHGMRTLRPGQEVDFELAGYPGRARVVWTRILGDRVESGFLILAGRNHGA